MAGESRKTRLTLLAEELDRSRAELAEGLRLVEEGVDVSGRISRSVARHPGVWAGGLGLCALGAVALLAFAMSWRKRRAAVCAEASGGVLPLAAERSRPQRRLLSWAGGLARRAIVRALLAMALKRVVAGWLKGGGAAWREEGFGRVLAMLRQAGAGFLPRGFEGKKRG